MDDTHLHASWSKSCQWIVQGMTGPAYRPAAFKCLGMQYVIIAYDIIMVAVQYIDKIGEKVLHRQP